MAHFKSFAEEIARRFRLNSQSLVVDIGSNDGILLRPFRERGVRALGVDPAEKIATHATAGGIETIPAFFTKKVAEDIVARYGHAAVVTANNVFAHINDLDEIVAGVKTLLVPDGVFITESAYLVDFLDQNLFDTVYHEHLSYFSVSSLRVLLERLGMKIIDMEHVGSHGGSLRVFAVRSEANRQIGEAVGRFIADERVRDLHTLAVYEDFGRRVAENKILLTDFLKKLRADGKRIAGYGAPAKGNTLLNYFSIGTETLDYIVDDSAWKQGLFSPGMHIPVVPPEKLRDTPPDYILILAWNFADLIMKKLEWFSAAGGKFIIPVPVPRIV